MADTERSDYPAMLANLQPLQAIQVLNDRVKRINKINGEIADWIQERRRVEEQYVQNLRKLLVFRTPNSQSDLGVFQSPWDRILKSVEAMALAHHVFSERLERDVEGPLRSFSHRKEMQSIQTITANLTSTVRELEDAQEKVDRLQRKGAKVNSQKLEDAAARLESSTQQWDSEAPYIFETLQAVDELRVNQLRDLLTQFQTHEADQAQRQSNLVSTVLPSLLELSTTKEIQSFAARTISGRPRLDNKPIPLESALDSSVAASPSTTPSAMSPEEDNGDGFARPESRNAVAESRLRRLGTMLGRKRQSVSIGFGQISPQKSPMGPFIRNIGSSHGRGLSPRPSFHNLSESNRPSSSLAQSTFITDESSSAAKEQELQEGTNGTISSASLDLNPVRSSSGVGGVNGLAAALGGAEGVTSMSASPFIFAKPSSPIEPVKDSEGFSIPFASRDPISDVQREASEESEQPFKVNIHSTTLAEEDADAKNAAFSNVASTLSQMSQSFKKSGTVRGRRDVRSTLYVPPPNNSTFTDNNPFPSPPPSLMPLSSSKSAGMGASLGSEPSFTATSDSQSVRSGTSIGGLAHLKHPDGLLPGLSASIIELMSVAFEGGETKNATIQGEIAFSCGSTGSKPESRHETIRIENFPNLSSVGPNPVLVHNTSPEQPDQFILDMGQISQATMMTAFSYRVFTSPSTSLDKYVPLLLRPAWKIDGDKLGLLVNYRLNPAFCTVSSKQAITLRNVFVIASYEGGRAVRAQTKPIGTHLSDSAVVYWRLGEITLSADSLEQDGEGAKIVCRIFGIENAELRPGRIEARWEYVPPDEDANQAVVSAISISRRVDTNTSIKDAANDGRGIDGSEVGPLSQSAKTEDDPFADDGPVEPSPLLSSSDRIWVKVPLARKLVSGKYEARA